MIQTQQTRMNEPVVNNDHSKQQKRQSDKPTPFCFYEAMQYPVPTNKETFAYKHPFQGNKKKSDSFSRSQKNLYLDSFLTFIKKRSRLYPQFPFIKAIYLANSITFNALQPSSDIDLFIITQKKRIWLARIRMAVIMRIFNIKRSKSNSRKKFCLSFFIDENKQNIKPLLLNEKDIYLPYRTAHLVPLYREKGKTNIFEENKRIQEFLPNRRAKQHIYLDLTPITKKGVFKTIIEFCFKGKRGNIRENIIAKFRSKRIIKQKAKNPELNKDIIISNYMLKFHQDKRLEYSKRIFKQK